MSLKDCFCFRLERLGVEQESLVGCGCILQILFESEKYSKGQLQSFVYLDRFLTGMNLISTIILPILSHRPFIFSAVSYVFVGVEMFLKKGENTFTQFITYLSYLVS
jgi:hypothetical protein